MGSISPAFSKYVYELWLLNKNKGLWYETQPSGQPPVNRVVYPEPTNKKRLTTTVRVTLKRTLTTNQKRHPLPIASRGLPYSRSRPRGNLPLEEDLFQDRFQVAHDLLLSFGV
jgi:hypothetical protein